MGVSFSRRDWLKSAGVMAFGTALGAGCAPAVVSTRRFAKVKVSPDRVIRTTVGLRPGRDPGFLVKTERFGDALVIHNYGHGGNGMSLSWGTSHLAAEEATNTDLRVAAVVGCGAVGLATARLLQRWGFAVTIYAKDVPPRTTSNMSGAWFSAGRPGPEATPHYVTQHTRAARLAYRYYQDLVDNGYGVRWIERYTMSEDPPDDPGAGTKNPLQDLRPEITQLQSEEHPFPYPYVQRAWTMQIEPTTYLAAMFREYRRAGGQLVVREFTSVEDVLSLSERLIVNCSGLGAKELFGDDELIPIKGQLTVLLPQSEVDYLTGAPGLYMLPRRDGIVLGSTRERGVWTLEPNPDEVQRVMDGHAELFAGIA